MKAAKRRAGVRRCMISEFKRVFGVSTLDARKSCDRHSSFTSRDLRGSFLDWAVRSRVVQFEL